MFNSLLGSQLVSLDECGFTVRSKGKERHFVFDEDHGDCCGYNNIEAKLLISEEEEANRNLIITNIAMERDDGGYGDGNSLTITFFGESKLLAQINSYSSSGSGWCYGATVTCKCVETQEQEVLTSW